MSEKVNKIYDYLDYREFISDRVQHLRDTNPNFSYRYFNKKAGFKSPNHLKQITDGAKNLGSKGMYGVCKGLGLSEKESRFFESLVRFNQSKSYDDKEKHYNEMIGRYPTEHPGYIESKFYKIFGHWYYIAILELIKVDGFKENPHWISKALKPNVPVHDVRKAIDELFEMGLIERNKNKKLVRTHKTIVTPEAVRDVAIIKFQQQLTKLAQSAIEKDRFHEKESSTLTFAVSSDTFSEVKKKIQEFKNEIREYVEEREADGSDAVAHMNLQMFKLSSGE